MEILKVRRKLLYQLLLRALISVFFAVIIPPISTPLANPDSKRRIALCYIRQSYTRTGEDAISPTRQRANIEAMLAGSGLTAEWYEDVGGHRSGAGIKNRPQWRELEK